MGTNDQCPIVNKAFTTSTVDSVQIEIQARVKRLAYPSEPGESVKSCIRRVSRHVDLTFTQTRRLWYGLWREIPTHVSDRIRQAALEHEHEINLQIERQRRKLDRLYAALNRSDDQEYYRQAVAQSVGRSDESG